MSEPLRGRAPEREVSALRRATSRLSRTRSAPTSSSPCLDDEEILALLHAMSGVRVDASVEAHLSSCPECRDLVLVSCASLDGTQPVLSSARRFCLMFEPGCVVAQRYCIRRLIGRGGMGEVFDALDLVRRESVALKTVRANASDAPATAARLITEAQLGQLVQHPNVCRTLELGRHGGADAGCTQFYTMQLVEGETLRKRLRRSRLGLSEAIQLGHQALRGLRAIHEAQIVHRDLKSDNLLVSTSCAHQQVTLIDFGLAKRLSDKGEAGAPHEGSGSRAYMAPEQASGERVGFAADVFSFGVLLFEAITGQLPPRGALLPRLGGLVAEAPSWLEAFIARCLESEPCRRFADAGEAARHFG